MFKNLWNYLGSVKRTLATPEVQTLLTLVVAILAIGTLFYRFVEQLGWVDAFYFSAITLTTVGYGDFTPQTPIGKIFTVGYIFIGFGLLATFLATVAEKALNKSDLQEITTPFSSVTSDEEDETTS